MNSPATEHVQRTDQSQKTSEEEESATVSSSTELHHVKTCRLICVVAPLLLSSLRKNIVLVWMQRKSCGYEFIRFNVDVKHQRRSNRPVLNLRLLLCCSLLLFPDFIFQLISQLALPLRFIYQPSAPPPSAAIRVDRQDLISSVSWTQSAAAPPHYEQTCCSSVWTLGEGGGGGGESHTE